MMKLIIYCCTKLLESYTNSKLVKIDFPKILTQIAISLLVVVTTLSIFIGVLTSTASSLLEGLGRYLETLEFSHNLILLIKTSIRLSILSICIYIIRVYLNKVTDSINREEEINKESGGELEKAIIGLVERLGSKK